MFTDISLFFDRKVPYVSQLASRVIPQVPSHSVPEELRIGIYYTVSVGKKHILRWWCFTYLTYLTEISEIPTIYRVLSWSNQLKSHWKFAAVSHLIQRRRGTPLAAEGTMKYGWELGGKSNSQLGISSSSCDAMSTEDHYMCKKKWPNRYKSRF